MISTKTKILICGDSFASPDLSGELGWPTLLSKKFRVTNLSKPGIGQYKILNQLHSQDLDSYDFIIVSHTSPYRVHTLINPCYPPGHLYETSDLIFCDIESKKGGITQSLKDYFKFIFDPLYYEFVHRKCCEEIVDIEKQSQKKFIHITHFDWTNLYEFSDILNFYETWLTNKGDFAHYNEYGNQLVFESILRKINYG